VPQTLIVLVLGIDRGAVYIRAVGFKNMKQTSPKPQKISIPTNTNHNTNHFFEPKNFNTNQYQPRKNFDFEPKN
jgi:hypothetical protein